MTTAHHTIVKDLLRRMLTGWCICEASFTDENTSGTLSEQAAMTQAFDGDAACGELFTLFSHWGNDVQSVAADKFLLAIINNKVVDLDPPPQPDYWWNHAGNIWMPPLPSVEDDIGQSA